MPTQGQIVSEFLAMWETPGGLDQSFRDYFTAGTVWENVGWVTTVGPEEAMALNATFFGKTGMTAIRVELLAVAEAGNKVLTERIDHLLDGEGNVLASPVVMGIFEMEGGKIAAWRDYFDTRGFVPPE